MLNKYKISNKCIPVKDQNSFVLYILQKNWFFINYHSKKTSWSWIDFLQKATCEVFLQLFFVTVLS